MEENKKCAACKVEFKVNDRRVSGKTEDDQKTSGHEEDDKKKPEQGRNVFHEACFKCATCKRSLVKELFVEQESVKEEEMEGSFLTIHVEMVELSCLTCIEKAKVKNCFGCKKELVQGRPIVRFLRQTYHPTCCLCETCRRVVTKEYFVREGKAYCSKPSCSGICLALLSAKSAVKT